MDYGPYACHRDDLRRALDAFQRGIVALHAAEGDPHASEEAVRALHECLEWATPATAPRLWAEAALALAECLARRHDGDALADARAANALYHAVLIAGSQTRTMLP